jgi:hypothetical protein
MDMIKEIKTECAFCKHKLIDIKLPTYPIIINDSLKMICDNCYNKYYYKTLRRCAICDKKIDYGVYFFQKANNISVVCKDCYNLVYSK